MQKKIKGTYEIQMQRELKMFADGRDKYLARLEKNSKLSTQNNAHKVITQAIPRVSKAIEDYLLYEETKSDGRKSCGYKDLKPIDPMTAAYIGLKVSFEGVATSKSRTKVLESIGERIELEHWSMGLRAFDLSLSKTIETKVVKNISSDFYRERAARAWAKESGYKFDSWDKDSDRHTKVAAIIFRCILEVSDLFDTWVKKPSAKPSTHKTMVGLTIEARDTIANTDHLQAWQEPMFRPSVIKLNKHTKFDSGAYYSNDSASQVPLVRHSCYTQRKAIEHQLQDGKVTPDYIEALNALQDTPLKINEFVLSAVKWAWENNKNITKFPVKDQLPFLSKPKNFSSLPGDDQKKFIVDAKTIRAKNREIDGQVTMMRQDLADAEELSGYNEFYLAWNLCTRGRVYPISNFSYHRDDHIKAMFMLADETRLDEDSIEWLAIHIANVWDLNKISKQSLEKRVALVNRRAKLIYSIGHDMEGTYRIWSKADKPFQFLAACHEFAKYMDCQDAGLGVYMCGLPISIDASCSGIQHYAAASLSSKDGALVNLIPSEKPQDIYGAVAEVSVKRLQQIADPSYFEGWVVDTKDVDGKVTHSAVEKRADRKTHAKMWLALGVDRSICKRNVMTYGYSSGKFGFGDQLIDDVMKKMATKVMRKELDKRTGKLFVHPFTNDEWTQIQCARLLAEVNYQAVQEVVSSASGGMGFFQKIAGALAHEGKHVKFETPTGFPMVQRYTHWDVRKVKIALYDRVAGVRNRVQISLRSRSAHSKVDKKKSKSAVAPNLIHAMDSSHLVKTILKSKREGVTSFFCIHDSFGTTPAETGVMYESVRETFVAMYDGYCLYDTFLKQAKKQLSQEGLEKLDVTVPPKGNLNLQDVIESEYCFS
jgi:DNA-directed RNA polymerase